MSIGYETSNGQVRSMWVEAGLQFRSNLLTLEHPEISLHSHSFDHVALITHGWVQVVEVIPSGETRSYQVASKDFLPAAIVPTGQKFNPVGYRILIPAQHQHSFTLIESHNQPAEILCIFPDSESHNHTGGC